MGGAETSQAKDTPLEGETHVPFLPCTEKHQLCLSIPMLFQLGNKPISVTRIRDTDAGHCDSGKPFLSSSGHSGRRSDGVPETPSRGP